MNYWRVYQRLYQDSSFDALYLDKRFLQKEWQENLAFDFIKRFYLLLSRHIDKLINDIEHSNIVEAKKIRFFMHQYLDAISPANFINTNPEVIAEIVETHGTNLVDSYKQFLEDLERG